MCSENRFEISRGDCGSLRPRRPAASSCVGPSETQGSEPMSLAAIIRHYLKHYQPLHDHELMWFHNQSSLEDALRIAGEAQDDEGHRYSHQRRVKSQAIREATRRLADSHDEIRDCSSFHDLWNLLVLRLSPIQGIGELYIYDTALRIGAHLRLTPEKVYLHAGTRIGARRLGLVPARDGSKQWLELTELPALLRDLAPSDVENLLCIYKSRLPRSNSSA